MSLADNDWYSALTRPSRTASTVMLLLGGWVLFLTIVNLVVGAYSDGDGGLKVLWFGFLSNGTLGDINTNHDGISVVVDDIVFGILGIILVALGHLGMNKALEGGTISAIKGLPECMSGLFSGEHGIRKTVADWMIVSGIVFYLSWSALYTGWVDVGVYAVTTTLFMFGFGLNILDKAES